MANIVHATQATQVAAVRALFAEYARAVDAPCCFVGLERELASLPGEYAPPAGRLGRALAAAAIAAARETGRSRVVLDTLPSMGEAIALYRSLDFKKVAPYLAAPTPGAV